MAGSSLELALPHRSLCTRGACNTITPDGPSEQQKLFPNLKNSPKNLEKKLNFKNPKKLKIWNLESGFFFFFFQNQKITGGLFGI
jgi:hypothetical protein